MSWINTPSGDQFAASVVRAVVAYPGKGVILRDAQNRLIAFIKIADPEKANRARDLIMQVVKGKRTYEINWNFLTEPTAIVSSDASVQAAAAPEAADPAAASN